MLREECNSLTLAMLEAAEEWHHVLVILSKVVTECSIASNEACGALTAAMELDAADATASETAVAVEVAVPQPEPWPGSRGGGAWRGMGVSGRVC